MSKAGIALGLPASLEGKILDLIATKHLPLEVVRRVLDTTEALAVAQAGLVHALVLDAQSFAIDAPTVLEIQRHRIPLVLICAPSDKEFFDQLGVSRVVAIPTGHSGPTELESLALQLLDETTQLVFPPLPEDPLGAPDANTSPETSPPADGGAEPKRGQVIVVWGTGGAPGRSTVALNLAASLSESGSVLLVDADMENPSLEQMLGVAPGASSVLSAARLALAKKLDGPSLQKMGHRLGESLQLLGGINKAGRWREVPPSALQTVLEVAREHWQWVVVDVGASLSLEQLSGSGPQVGDATVAALQMADLTVILALADPVGMHRLLTLLPTLEQIPLLGKALVVVNRLRAPVAGANPRRAVRELAALQMPAMELAFLEEDQQLLDQALLHATNVATISETAQLCEDFVQLNERVRHLLGHAPLRRRAKGHTSGRTKRRSREHSHGQTRKRSAIRFGSGPSGDPAGGESGN